MSSKDLTMGQRAALFDAAANHRDWCGKVVERAKACDWPADDPVTVAAEKASEALSVLVSAVYASGETHPPTPPLSTRAEEMARRKRRKL